MSQSPTPPVPVINPILLDQWNELPANKPLGLDLTRQDWDLILAALLDLNGSVSSLAAFVMSEGTNRDWASFSSYSERNSNAHARIVRFVETVMYKATKNG